MKKITILLSAIILFAACNKSVDKKTELAKLKADAKEINAKIAALEQIALLKNSQSVVLDNVAHAGMFEKPNESAKVVSAFLSKI